MKFRIAFLTANYFGYTLLYYLLKNEFVKTNCEVLLYTLHPESKTKMYDGIKTFYFRNLYNKYNNITKFYLIKHITYEKDKEKFFENNLDLLIAAGWRQIIPKDILYYPKRNTIGFHPAPLPKGRGPAPLINTILLGWKKTAMSLYYLDEGIDSGDIIEQFEIDVSSNDYVFDLYKKMIKAGVLLLRKNIESILFDKVKAYKQQEENAYYFPKLSLKDNEIFKEDIVNIDKANRKIRAFSFPYKGAFIRINKDYILRIYKGYFIKFYNKQKNYLELDIDVLKGLAFFGNILKNLKIKINNDILLNLELGKVEKVLS